MPSLWDISPPVHADSPVFPWDVAFGPQWSACIGPAQGKALPGHQVIRGLCVLQKLRLAEVPERHDEWIALPLKLSSADASPVRAVLRELENR